MAAAIETAATAHGTASRQMRFGAEVGSIAIGAGEVAIWSSASRASPMSRSR